jgi:hypothetical protein
MNINEGAYGCLSMVVKRLVLAVLLSVSSRYWSQSQMLGAPKTLAISKQGQVSRETYLLPSSQIFMLCCFLLFLTTTANTVPFSVTTQKASQLRIWKIPRLGACHKPNVIQPQEKPTSQTQNTTRAANHHTPTPYLAVLKALPRESLRLLRSALLLGKDNHLTAQQLPQLRRDHFHWLFLALAIVLSRRDGPSWRR